MNNPRRTFIGGALAAGAVSATALRMDGQGASGSPSAPASPQVKAAPAFPLPSRIGGLDDEVVDQIGVVAELEDHPPGAANDFAFDAGFLARFAAAHPKVQVKLLYGAHAELREQLLANGMEPQPSTPEELARYIDREFTTWGRVVKEAGIQAE